MSNIEVSASLVKELRTISGAGIMDCKKALKECEGDIKKSVEYLRIKGMGKADGKADRQVAEGLVGSYIHSTGKIGVLVEVNCETDFVARTDEFQELVNDIAMHIAGYDPFPMFVRKEEVDNEIVEKERSIYLAQAKETGKPDNIIEKMVEGRVDKFIKGICLMDQSFIKSNDMTISDLVKEKIAKLGENISIKKFIRFQISK